MNEQELRKWAIEQVVMLSIAAGNSLSSHVICGEAERLIAFVKPPELSLREQLDRGPELEPRQYWTS